MDMISSNERSQYRSNNTRVFTLLDGRREPVYMPPSLWTQYEALLVLDDIQEAEVVDMALKEKELQPADISFSECFRCVVTEHVLAWFEAAEAQVITAEYLGT